MYRRSIPGLLSGLVLSPGRSPLACGSLPDIRVLTSFPPAVFEPFRDEFEAAHPGCRVDFIQRNTTAAVTRIASSEWGPGAADLFWASAPDAFEWLKAGGRLARTAPRPTGAPARVAGQPVDDADGTYLGFAVSAYGLAYNPEALADAGIGLPHRWEDLAAAAYHGHLGLSPPSRSGTTHIVVEALLQRLGWDQGWHVLRGIGGNLATLTARSFGVTSGVARGRFAIGISIDFLATGGAEAAGSLRFMVPDEPVVAPASIGVLADAPNPEGAESFIDFVLSPAGQALLRRPGIGRTPLHPPEALARFPAEGVPLDHALSARRYELVNLLFDEAVTHRQAELSFLTRRLHAVEARLAQQSDHAVTAAATAARAALFDPPLEEADANDPDLAGGMVRVPRTVPRTASQAVFEARLRQRLEAGAARAAAALRLAEQRLGIVPDPAAAPAPGLRRP